VIHDTLSAGAATLVSSVEDVSRAGFGMAEAAHNDEQRVMLYAETE
jgi:hypothetical protein